MTKSIKSDAEKYDKKTPREHVLIRPDTYIGDIEPTNEDMWVFMGDNKIIKKSIKFTPGFLKVFDELIVNARDASVNDASLTTIKIEYNIKEGYISIYNNGDIGIPVEEHPTFKTMIPSMIFGELLTSSNYDDTEERTTGGRNGYGSKCLCPNTNIPMWNGEMKLAKDIKIGDQLIGDDGTIRNVNKVISGSGQMYDVFQAHGEIYRVNDEHILTLHMPDHKVIFWNNTKCSWSILWWNNQTKSINAKNIRAYKPEIKCDICDTLLVDNLNRHIRRCHPEIEITKKLRKSPEDKCIQDARIKIEEFSKTIDDNNIFDISIKDYMKLDKTTKKRLAGVRGKCVQWKFKEVLLDPYILGLWLGDSKKDFQIIDYLNDATINNFRIKKLLEKYNLINNKHIPNEYIVNDKITRLKILAGIIDTDGTVCRDGTQIIITQGLKHKQLVYDIVKLSRSLGFSCQLTIKNTQWTYKNELKQGKAYNINISGDNIIDIPTKLPRKKCANTISKNTSYSTGFIEIKEADSNQFIGFEIDNNQRFLINDFTVTHNCANIFSTKFIVEINDATRKKAFKQEWTNNMEFIGKAEISKLPAKTKSSVKVIFYPDLKRFNITDLDNDHLMLFHKRAIDIAGTSNKLQVFFNDVKIEVSNFRSYINLYYTLPNELYFDNNDRWSIGVFYKPDAGGEVISFVNSINTYKGGTHCAYIIDNIIKILLNDYIKKKDKNIKISPAVIKENFVFFINSIIVNPAFSSQTKDTLTTKADKFGSKYEPSPQFIKKLAKCGIVEQIIELSKFKENSSLKKTDGKKQIKIVGIPKLEDANKAGTKDSYKCTLILTEGDSAKATAMAGLGVVGRDYYGVFPLKGKLLNVRDAPVAQLLGNEEIKNLKIIIGLKQDNDYSTNETFNTLRYGHILLLTDQDTDGSHIKGLFINMMHTLWPSLIKRPDFIQSLNTPIVKAIKGKNILTFYNLTDYDNWKVKPESKNYNIKYYKGLGTSTTIEAKEYFVDINTKLINYIWENDEIEENEESDSENFKPLNNDDDAIKLAFDKSRTNDRKKWLMQYDKEIILKYEQKEISYYDFIHKDLIHFSNDDLNRSIPSVVDGLKPSQRKILYGAYLRGLDKTQVKVAQLAGFVSDKAAYHHGEMSLNGAIVGMAQNFVGSNNINILVPAGQFGTRLKGGKDAASSRYIWTELEKITLLIYNSNDNPVLKMQYEDESEIEPEYYVPIIPMILVNGSEGIGTGFSTKVPPYNPLDIINNIKNIINDKPFQQMNPWWRGFEGKVNKIDDLNYEICGNYEIKKNKLKITELPVGEWTSNYKEFLEKLLDEKNKQKKSNSLISYKDNNTDSIINFELTFEDDYLDDVEDIDKLLHLTKKYSITNMHLYSAEGRIKKYNNVEEILRDYYDIRLNLYQKRKDYLLEILLNQLIMISAKVKFILMVIDKKIEINNKKKEEIELSLEKNKFEKLGKNNYDYLLTMPIYNLTNEKIQELKNNEKEKQLEYDNIEKKSIKNMWLDELKSLEIEYKKF